VILYGWHSVKAALENPARKFHRLLVSENAAHRLAESGIALPIAPSRVRAEEIEALVGPEAVHQGILAEADPLESPAIEDLDPQRLVLVLDQITDPHNVGAILRSAVAFGVEAVITTSRHSPEATGVLAKAASAALEHVPIVTVPNLSRALEALKEKNVFVVGLDSSGDADLASVPLRAPLALVVGAEGKGLRQLTRSTCDAVARIALPGRIKSLNVSNATALALFVASGRLAPG
jgi:23S rRNA (guanosine2251-2'-O)-methyltransferase